MEQLELTPEELERYDRQIGPGVLSADAQRRLKQSTALVPRVGGMGGPASPMLAMGGVGRWRIGRGGRLITPGSHRRVLGGRPGMGSGRRAGGVGAGTGRGRGRTMAP